MDLKTIYDVLSYLRDLYKYDVFDFRQFPFSCEKWELWERSYTGSNPSPLVQSAPAMAFDPRSFCRTVNDKGRAYQHRAMEIIKICTVFSVASEQSLHQIVRLQR